MLQTCRKFIKDSIVNIYFDKGGKYENLKPFFES